MAIITASGGAGAAGCRVDWSLLFDDVARTVTFDCTHTHFDGSPAPDPQQADVIVTLSNGQPRTFDLLTTVAPSDGQPGLLNKGPQTFTGVNLRVDSGRARGITFSTAYVPPAA